MALYRYVPGKAELVALMVEAGIGAPPATTRANAWRPGLRACSRALFAKRERPPEGGEGNALEFGLERILDGDRSVDRV
jgi:hypothetical protein